MFRKRLLASVVLTAILISALPAEDRSITLEEAVALALDRHPAVVLARQGVDAARGRRMQLEAVPNPELTFEAVGLPLWNSSGEKEFSLGFSQLIEHPRKRAVRRDIGALGEARAQIELDRARNVVRGRVERAYFEAAFAQKSLADLESFLLTLEDYTGLAVERYKAGEVAYLDVVRGRLETLRARNQIIEGRRLLKEKTLALILLLGDSGYAPLSFSTPVGFAPLGKTWEELKAAALAGSSLRLAAEREKLAGRSLALARTMTLPDFTLGFFLPSKRLGGWGVEFGLSLPLQRKAPRGAAMEAEALVGQAAVSTAARTREVLAVLERSYADALALEEQIRLFQDSLLREVEESLKTGIINYRFGKSDSLSVLDIVRSLKEVRFEYLKALLNHRLSLIDIAAAGEDGSFGMGEIE
ncbi:MAG: TolC family protein [Candidatus Aminicenantes bacterium]|nr:TolC family protein [Candidatus Aminicenantes bacterium]